MPEPALAVSDAPAVEQLSGEPAEPARVLEDNEAAWKGIVETWLNTAYADAPRYNRRNAQLDEIV